MVARNETGSIGTDGRESDPSGPTFQFASGVYGGVLLAGVVAIAAAAVDAWPIGLASTYAAGFAVGCIGGFLFARVDRHLPIRLGRTLRRRVALVLPALLFALAWFVPLEGPVGGVALPSAILVFAAGYVLSQLAGNRYVDAVAPGEPDETWRWEPPGSFVLDVSLAVVWAALAVGNAVVGNWLEGLLWLTVAGGWIGSCLAEGRWAFGPGRDRCEIQFYETGLVKRRPYTKRFVAWRDITHTRFREGELVLDSGLRDVRFDRDELEDPHAVLEAVDRRLSQSTAR